MNILLQLLIITQNLINFTLNKSDKTSVARFVISASNTIQDEKCILHFVVQCALTADSGC
jgi:hypothetical protein